MRQLKVSPSFTVRDTVLDKYLTEVWKIPMIDAEKEVELAHRRDSGDRQAVEALTRANLRFVISVAKQYQNQGLSLPDLINEGNLGLMKAAEKFDATRGFKFISYAVWQIRQSIQQALTDVWTPIRMPTISQSKLSKIKATIRAFEQEYWSSPTFWELAKLLGYDEKEIRALLSARTTITSLDMPLGGGKEGDSTLIDVLAWSEETDDSFKQSDLKLMLQDAFKRCLQRKRFPLSERQVEILKLHYGIGCQEMSLGEIAGELKITRERVRQLHENALRSLQKSGEFDCLKEYL